MPNCSDDERPAKIAKISAVNNLEESNYLKSFKNAKVILLDIEGTTTPIDFVSKTLFPYAKSNVKPYLSKNYPLDDALQANVKMLQKQCKIDVKEVEEFQSRFAEISLDDETEIVIDAVVDYVIWLIENDRKVTPLKQLQGNIWKNAYESGKIKGELFEDVQSALELWKEEGKLIYIYSSGSVQAQKLLFQHSANGDLLPLIKGHFDTTIGSKLQKESYTKIAENLEMKSSDILFLTDVTAEAKAALDAGLSAFILCRPGNKPIQDKSKYICIDNFACMK